MILRVIQTCIKALPWAVKYEWRQMAFLWASFIWMLTHHERRSAGKFLYECGEALGRSVAMHQRHDA